MNPKVSFIVPCYKLGHLLPECVESILSQTYRDFEVLIMDDSSPDDTPEVAKSFQDPRVKHIRNDPNLGHLKNYNKGIGLARGEYIWLISADDSLRSPHVLERYVQLMDNNPNVGFVFCPAMKLVDRREVGVMPYSLVAGHDTVISGHKLLKDHLIFANIVPAPAAMARKKCYEQANFFPLDLPHTGDWYLWGMFALCTDVGFFAEAMVNRRFHESNMSADFCKEAALTMFANNLAVPLRILEKTRRDGLHDLVESCKRGVAAEYLKQLAPAEPGDVIQKTLSEEEFEDSLRLLLKDPKGQTAIRAQVYAGLADVYYERNEFSRASQYYRRALQQDRGVPKVWAKYMLVRMGSAGKIVRKGLSSVKQHLRKSLSAKA